MPPPRNLLADALAHHAQGQLAAAETLYQQILQLHPDAFRAIEGLGVLRMQQGLVSEAANLFARGLAVRPNSARSHANLGEALRILGQTGLAVDHLGRAAALDPTLAQVPNSLGLVAFDAGRRDQAEAAYRDAIRLDPRMAAARINLANVHHVRQRNAEAVVELRMALALEPDNRIALATLAQVLCTIGDLDLLPEAEALCRRAAAVAPQFPPAFENLGNILRAQKRYAEAIASYQHAARLDPGRGMPYHYLGELFQNRGDFDRAARCFTRAHHLEPTEAQFHADLGNLAMARGQHEQAAAHYRQAIECKPRAAEYHYGLGLAILEQARLDQAESHFEEAARIEPDFAGPWCALARLQAERGEFDAACRSARVALEKSPGIPDAYWRLALIQKGDLPEADARAIESLIARKSLTDGERGLLHFGLALRADAHGLFTDAAAHLEKANSLQGSAKAERGEARDPGRYSTAVDRTIAVYTRALFARGRDWGVPDPRPIFIVGLPRTGSSLVEQILASHPHVHGAGELPDLQRVFLNLPDVAGQPSADPFEILPALGPDSAQSAARAYLGKLDTLAPKNALRIVDKMPENIQFLGLIALLLPAARVIVCTRDLRDVALSCWRTGFEENAWANDWDHMARRFADYQRLVDHWEQVLPVSPLVIRYEDLVNELETHARNLIDFAGLDWNPACLQFHETKRVVRTASLGQVRKPIYTDSVARWRHYEPFLQPLFEAFERHGVRLP
jgi:tetratricopeptide (TPR) repeat protein